MDRTRRRRWLTGGGNLLAVLVIYFAIPVEGEQRVGAMVVGILLAFAAALVSAGLVVRELRQSTGISGTHLIVAAEVVLVVFAFTYYLLAANNGNQMVGVSTRLDALYFSMTTMTTVGYGDVHASGQLARGIVTVQLAFDVLFIALLGAVARKRLSERGGK